MINHLDAYLILDLLDQVFIQWDSKWKGWVVEGEWERLIKALRLLLHDFFSFWLTHLMPLFSFYTWWKHQKTSGFRTFSGV